MLYSHCIPKHLEKDAELLKIFTRNVLFASEPKTSKFKGITNCHLFYWPTKKVCIQFTRLGRHEICATFYLR